MISLNELRQIPLLSELEDQELTRLSEVMKERRAPKGSYIVYVEDPGPSMMFIAEGKVKISLISNEGKEIVLASLGPGEFFGEIALLTGEDRSANVVASTDCRLFVLYAADFKKHILDNTGLSYAMMKELALRLRAASTKIGDLALFDVYRRVARTLKGMGAKQGGEDTAYLVVEDRPTHQELAAMVGTSREMVTRALKGLEEDGCIVISGKKIEIHKLPI